MYEHIISYLYFFLEIHFASLVKLINSSFKTPDCFCYSHSKEADFIQIPKFICEIACLNMTILSFKIGMYFFQDKECFCAGLLFESLSFFIMIFLWILRSTQSCFELVDVDLEVFGSSLL